jgi:PiT family inorganic phosphate transporter
MFFLIVAVGLALSFEFVNGFHDTANAVATVIYTHTLKPWVAVIWSGCWNLTGVMCSSGLVAFTVLALLPVELVVNVGSSTGFAMVFALLISAILWNLGTWYLGLPASSSHTLIGSIMGVGLANSLLAGHVFGEGVNWAKVNEVFMSLLISPVLGFVFAGLLLIVLKLVVRKPELYQAPPKDQPPPGWIRALLIFTCTGVSFFHGSNDGQKGMGLLLLILIGILPASYALNMDMNSTKVTHIQSTAVATQAIFDAQAKGTVLTDAQAADAISSYLKTTGKFTDQVFPSLAVVNQKITSVMAGKQTFAGVNEDDRRTLRTNIYLVSAAIAKLDKQKQLTDKTQATALVGYRKELDSATQYLPTWVKVAVALALGLGTMIGWKRIVTTVGEKIGKEHLTYAQGASAELVAMATIGLADGLHLPVSTTHVLSSGVAGTMAANHSGLQMGTLRNLLLAWVLTLPVCVILGAGTFSGALFIVFHNLTLPAAGIAGVIILLILWRIWVVKNRPREQAHGFEVASAAK